jgi:hypothetical protein
MTLHISSLVLTSFPPALKPIQKDARNMQVCQYIAGSTVFHPETQEIAGKAMHISGRYYPCVCVKDGLFIESSGAVDGSSRSQLSAGQALRDGEYNMPACMSTGLQV